MNLCVMQISDLHLGAGVLPIGHGFGEQIARIREQEEHELLARIRSIIVERNIDLVLIPGDLWDQEAISISLVRRVIDWCAELNPLPIIIVPGNHDFLGTESPYCDQVALRYGIEWSRNVTIVRHLDFTSFKLEGIPDFSFTAMATGMNVPITTRQIHPDLPKSPDSANVLLFHGSLEQGGLLGQGDAKKITAPFNREELLNAGFVYAAIGHYHSFTTIQDSSGRIRAAYSGAPFAREFRHPESKGVLVFELDRNGVVEGSMELVPTDSRRCVQMRIDLTGTFNDSQAIARINNQLAGMNFTENDLVRLHLIGTFGSGPFWNPGEGAIIAPASIDLITSSLKPEFDAEKFLQTAATGSAHAVFLKRMLVLIREAELNSPVDERRLIVLKLAMSIGNQVFNRETPLIRTEPVLI